MILKRHNVERKVSSEAEITRLKKDGYEEVANAMVQEDAKATSFIKMKVGELRALAAEQGIEGCESMNKAELIEILKDVV